MGSMELLVCLGIEDLLVVLVNQDLEEALDSKEFKV